MGTTKYYNEMSQLVVAHQSPFLSTQVIWREIIRMFVCMYVFIDREDTKSAQKRSYWGENRIKRKIYE